MERVAEEKVVFDYPVVIKGSEVESITLRKPKVKDMQRAAEVSTNPATQEVWIVSALAGVPIADIEELDLDQYELIQEALGKFKRSLTRSA